jgi:hypothetical protein
MKPAPWGPVSNTGTWGDHEDRLTAEWLQRKGILVDVGTAAQAVQTVSKDRSFHPVRQYLESVAINSSLSFLKTPEASSAMHCSRVHRLRGGTGGGGISRGVVRRVGIGLLLQV